MNPAGQAPSDACSATVKVHVAPLESDHLTDATAGVGQEQDEREVPRLAKSSNIEKMLKLPGGENLVRGHSMRPGPTFPPRTPLRDRVELDQPELPGIGQDQPQHRQGHLDGLGALRPAGPAAVLVEALDLGGVDVLDIGVAEERDQMNANLDPIPVGSAGAHL